jgi:hypothetical protein
MISGSGEPARDRFSGSGEPAAPRRQSLLRASRCALLPAATPRVRAVPHIRRDTAQASQTCARWCCRALRRDRAQASQTCARWRFRAVRRDTAKPLGPASGDGSGKGASAAPRSARQLVGRQRARRRRASEGVAARQHVRGGVAAGRSAQREARSSDWRRGAAGSPDPEYLPMPGSTDPEYLPMPGSTDTENLPGSPDPENLSRAGCPDPKIPTGLH